MKTRSAHQETQERGYINSFGNQSPRSSINGGHVYPKHTYAKKYHCSYRKGKV